MTPDEQADDLEWDATCLQWLADGGQMTAAILRLSQPSNWTPCPDCAGTGEIEGDGLNRNGYYTVLIKCPTCRGEGMLEREEVES